MHNSVFSFISNVETQKDGKICEILLNQESSRPKTSMDQCKRKLK